MINTGRPCVGDRFFNREDILKQLKSYFKVGQNVALVGWRRLGKSSIALTFLEEIIKEGKNYLPVYFIVQEKIGTPDRFAIRLLISFLDAYFKYIIKKSPNIDLITIETEIREIFKIEPQIESQKFSELVKFLLANYPTQRIENTRITFEKIFNFINDFAEEKNLFIALILDEFQEILQLEQYKKVFRKNDVLRLLEGKISLQQKVWYCLTGSMISMMSDILESPETPFLGRFRKISVGPFSKEYSKLFILDNMEKPFSGEALELIYNISGGNPFYIGCICNSAEINSISNFIIKDDVEEAFVEEIQKGNIENVCRYIFDTSLERLRGRISLLKDFLRFIAEKDIVDIKVLEKQFNMTCKEIKPILRTLQKVDLIIKDDNNYKIIDPILSTWLKSVYGFSVPQFEKIRKYVDDNYQRIIAELKTERGYLIESYIRELFSKFDNTEFKEIKLLKFSKVTNLNIYDHNGIVFEKPSNIEIDVYCESETENWLGEIKYIGEVLSKKDLELLLKKKKFIENEIKVNIHKTFYISVSGFSEESIKLAQTNNIWLIDEKILNILFDKFNLRKLKC